MNLETIEILKVIKKSSDLRTKEEVEKILPYLTSRSELLNNLRQDVLFELIKHCRHQKCKKNELVIKQGAIGDRFYVVVTGHVSVYISSVKSDDTFDEAATVEKRNELESFFDEIDSLLGNMPKPAPVSPEKQEEQSERSTLGKFIMLIESGKSFGELALLSENPERNASIVADIDNMDLLVVDKELYDRTIKECQLAEYKDKREFIAKHPLFKTWGMKLQRLLEMSMTKEVYNFDSVIVRQGLPFDGLYFIISGEAKLMIDPMKHKSQYSRLMSSVDSASKKPLAQNIVHVKRKFGYAEAEKMVNQKCVALTCLSEGDVFGDLESITQLPTYMGSLLCVSQVVVLHINSKNLDRLVVKKNPRTYEQFKDATFSRYTDMLKTRVGQLAPLLRVIYDKYVHEEEAVEVTHKSKPRDKNDKDFKTAHLLQLFTEGKMQLFEPCVPDSVYFRYKSIERRKHALSARERILKEQRDNSVSGKLRNLHEMRKKALSGNGRRPRSRRELNNVKLSDFAASQKVMLKYHEYGTTENLEQNPIPHSNPSTRPASSAGHRAQSTIVHQSDRASAKQRPHTSHPTRVRIKTDNEMITPGSADEGLQHNERTLGEHDGTPSSAPAKSNQSSLPSQKMPRRKASSAVMPKEETLNEIGDYPLVAFFNVLEVIEQRREAMKSKRRPQSAPDQLLRLLNGTGDSLPDPNLDQSESSNAVLLSLEQRLHDFHLKILKDQDSEKPVITELKRCNLQNMNPPVAGGTVFVKMKPCLFKGSSEDKVEEHNHIKRYILPRLKTY
ncbi:uncharacterized protein [Watersipora subatra]|uniref:uncharacterized protein n=1 Tax=Watersipora subatra TaxID=2589382 RepID=UPI00355AD044